MRAPINGIGGSGIRWPSTSVQTTVELFELMPGAAGTGGQVALATLNANNITLTDDASQAVRRTMTMDIARPPSTMKPGMWIRVTIGVPQIRPAVYRLPSLMITEVSQAERLGAHSIACADPGEQLNGNPYLSDVVLTGTLRSLVQAACATLSRPPDVTSVPTTAVPVGTIAEFGAGAWDTCLRIADELGIDLRFTDAGDVSAYVRNSTIPAPVATIEQVALGGTFSCARTPTQAKVLVTRGQNTVGLIGSARVEDVTGTAPPAWYPAFIVTDRMEGDPNTTQIQADVLAKNLMRARISEIDSYDGMSIMPSPWLEAGADTVMFRNVKYWVRAVSLDVPSLATTVTLRRAL